MITGKLLLVGANTRPLAISLGQRGYETAGMLPERYAAEMYAEHTMSGIAAALFHFDDLGLAEETALNYSIQPPVLVYYSEWPVNGRLQREERYGVGDRPGIASIYWLTSEDPAETDIVDHFLGVSSAYELECFLDTADTWEFEPNDEGIGE